MVEHRDRLGARQHRIGLGAERREGSMLRGDIGRRHRVPRDLGVRDDPRGPHDLQDGLAERTRRPYGARELHRFAHHLGDRVAERIVGVDVEPASEEPRTRELGDERTAPLRGRRPRAGGGQQRRLSRGAVRGQDRPRAPPAGHHDVRRRVRRTALRDLETARDPQDVQEPIEVAVGCALASHAEGPSHPQSRPVAASSRAFHGANSSRSLASVSARIPAGFVALYARQAGGCQYRSRDAR